MSSFNDQNHMDEAFKKAQIRFRATGTALGRTIESDKHGKPPDKTADEKLEEAKSGMVKDKYNISTFGKQNPDSIKKQTGIRTFNIKNPKEANKEEENEK